MPLNSNKKLPSVAVVVPVYNEARFLKLALQSVVEQDCEVEIIIVDDGSIPKATEDIKQICAGFKKAKLLTQPHGGPAAARAFGVASATAEAIVFLDADDVLQPGALNYLAQALMDHPEAVGVYGRHQAVWENGAVIGEPVPPRHMMVPGFEVLPALLSGQLLLLCGTMCIRKSALARLTLDATHLEFGEDWTMWCHLALLGPLVPAGERIVLHYRRHSDNTSSRYIEKPELLFAALDMIYTNPSFVAAVGEEKLRAFKQSFVTRIHANLASIYARRGESEKAKYFMQKGSLFMKERAMEVSGSDVGVTVVVPVYNVTRYLKEAIESVVQQDYKHKAVIVVDDGSQPEAAAEIASLCKLYPEVTLLRKDHAGAAVARHAGVVAATSELVMFLDADDYLLPGAISYLALALRNNPDAIVAYGRHLEVDEQGRELVEPQPPLHWLCSGFAVLEMLLQGNCLLSNGTVCMRRDAFLALPPVNHGLTFAEDWTLWCHLAYSGNVISAGDRVVMHYRRHTHNISSTVPDAPQTLFEALERVYKNPMFIKAVGQERMHILQEHFTDRLHADLAHAFAKRRDHANAMIYFKRGSRHMNRRAIKH